ncbi:hypothetical protein GALMADRAFT_785909 [Galerina marginata CBS 339.88]|uniref:Uncharacterized protein n=1 Tax=Galerina marginata (strain CBS 339.88) TaxID=685588 RepID=A0A067SKI3_GALM3|nr:hypothetical protein GALMADRAFT_785909 [Galerina marginata CBS 339.88]
MFPSTSHSHPHPNGNSTSNPNPNSTYDPHPPSPHQVQRLRHQITNILCALWSQPAPSGHNLRLRSPRKRLRSYTNGVVRRRARRAGINGRVKPNDVVNGRKSTPPPPLASILFSGSPTSTPTSPNLRRGGGKRKEKVVESDTRRGDARRGRGSQRTANFSQSL